MGSHSKNENSESGIFDQARDMVQENVKPPQTELTKEKPVPDKVLDNILSAAADAGTSAVNTVENATQTVKDKVPALGKQQQQQPNGGNASHRGSTGITLSKESMTPNQSDCNKKEENKETEATILGRLKEKLLTLDDDDKNNDGHDDKPPKPDDPPAFLDGERIDQGFEDIKEKLPREINTLGDRAGTKITDGFEQVKEALPNKLEPQDEKTKKRD